MNEIPKPCPFCGEHKISFQKPEKDRCWYSCSKCGGCRGQFYMDEITARNAWNTRHEPSGKLKSLTFQQATQAMLDGIEVYCENFDWTFTWEKEEDAFYDEYGGKYSYHELKKFSGADYKWRIK